MGSYVPATVEERRQMLDALGMEDPTELYADVPASMLLTEPLAIPAGKSELEVRAEMEALAAKNTRFRTILRGAGAYDHYIPSIVKYIPSKEEFLTAYTPYQAEISQGILQSIFEYQTMVCQLTGMDAANASVYDGATAAAEAAAMCRDRKRTVTLISETVHPDVLGTVRTYCYGTGHELRVVPAKDGKTDLAALETMLTEDVASVIVQTPNFYGFLEDAKQIGGLVHEKKALFVMSCNPISLAILATPAECGADIAVMEGQPLGLPLGFGGPYLGIMACTQKLMRKLPGRIVGQTEDAEGRRAFVLSLQAREQHIRREKASSNICSNEALCAMTAGLYLATIGPEGLKETARQCMSKAHYFAGELCKLPGVRLKYQSPFFHEFVTVLPKANEVLDRLADAGILGGLPLTEEPVGAVIGRPQSESNGVLWCVTEKVSKAELDRTVSIVKEVLAG